MLRMILWTFGVSGRETGLVARKINSVSFEQGFNMYMQALYRENIIYFLEISNMLLSREKVIHK